MNWILGIAGACVGSLFIYLPVQEPVIHSLKKNIALSSSSLKQQTDLSEAEVCDRAEKVTIKILSENEIAEGTGILVKKEQGKDLFIYTVLTNAHVVRERRNYQVKTNDDRSHGANLISSYDQNSSGDDLAILQFNSKSDYDVATFRSASTLESGDRVFAAGFPVVVYPSVPRGFECKSGEISLILDREMELGYKVGYYVDIKKGMSGGPLLNGKGEVVGINGKHSHPLPFGGGNQDPYVYRNGNPVDRSGERRDLLENSSWAIPIEKLKEREYVAIIDIYIAEAPRSTPSPLPLPEPIVQVPESTQSESQDPESIQLAPQDPGSTQQPASESTQQPAPQVPESTQQASQVPPESTEPVLPSELENRALNCPSNISTLQQSRSEPMEDSLNFNNENNNNENDNNENDNYTDKKGKLSGYFVRAKLSCKGKNCSLKIIRGETRIIRVIRIGGRGRRGRIVFKDVPTKEFNIPIEDRGEVFDIQVQDMDKTGEGGIREPEVIVSLIEDKESNKCYSLVYRYYGDIGYKKDPRPIETSNNVEGGED